MYITVFTEACCLHQIYKLLALPHEVQNSIIQMGGLVAMHGGRAREMARYESSLFAILGLNSLLCIGFCTPSSSCPQYGACADVPKDSVKPSGPYRALWHICALAGDLQRMCRQKRFETSPIAIFAHVWETLSTQTGGWPCMLSCVAELTRNLKPFGK